MFLVGTDEKKSVMEGHMTFKIKLAISEHWHQRWTCSIGNAREEN